MRGGLRLAALAAAALSCASSASPASSAAAAPSAVPASANAASAAPPTPAPAYTARAMRLSSRPLLSAADSGGLFDVVDRPALFVEEQRVGLLATCRRLGQPSVLCASFFTSSRFDSAAAITQQSVVARPQGPAEKCGIGGARVASFGEAFYVFFTADDCSGTPHLALARSTDLFSAAAFQRVSENIFSAQPPFASRASTSGAPFLLSFDGGSGRAARVTAAPPRQETPNLLLWGDNSGGFGISLASSVGSSVTHWTVNYSNWMSVRAKNFDSFSIEAGAPPVAMDDGNLLFLYNSAREGYPSYMPDYDLQQNIGFAVVAGDGSARLVQRGCGRSSDPLLTPLYAWELANATGAEGPTPNSVYVSGAIDWPGEPGAFLVVYGGGGASVGVAKLEVVHI